MQLLHESTVLPEEIDSLGHMNVRFYMSRMEAANQVLIKELGVSVATAKPSYLRRVDTYTRFLREQFEGATLHTKGGVLEFTESGMRSYVEISNPETEAVAATFIVTTQLTDSTNRNPLPFDTNSTTIADASRIDVPGYAQPRSLSLGPVNNRVTLAELDAVIPDVEGTGMMSGRRQTTVEDDDVDATGWLHKNTEVMFLPFMKMAQVDGVPPGPPVFTTADGQRVGWAVMETRTLVYSQPRLSDTLSYFNTDIAVEEKSRLSRRWAFNATSGELLGISDNVGLCIDLDARRAIAWPEEIRALIEQHQQPQLA